MNNIRKILPFHYLKRDARGFHVSRIVREDNKNQDKKKFQMYGPVSYGSLGVLALALGGIVAYYLDEKQRIIDSQASKVTTVGKAALGGPWVLVDHNGIPKTDAEYRGQFVILYFGFTYCPDICPNELVKIGKILQLADKKLACKIKPVFISVDPVRDSVGQMRHYKKDFDPRFDFLTGTSDQIAAVTKAYRVYYSKANENEEDDNDYLVDHSIVLYLLSPEGEFLEFFTKKTQVNDIVDSIEKHVKNYANKV